MTECRQALADLLKYCEDHDWGLIPHGMTIERAYEAMRSASGRGLPLEEFEKHLRGEPSALGDKNCGETPRTDAQEVGGGVNAAFARQLERELAASEESRLRWIDRCKQLSERLVGKSAQSATAPSAEWRQLGETACRRYVEWYATGLSAQAGDMAYELVSYIRQMLAAASTSREKA